jgi:hypothetical protein
LSFIFSFKIRKEAKRMEGFEKVGDGLAHVLLIVSFGI